MVGAGKAEGAMDAGNMLKPALARGELHCIGATTVDEYRKYIEKDAALERRFQPVMVGEPSRPGHHQPSCAVSRSATRFTTASDIHRLGAWWPRPTLSNRYISDRFLPDKAIDLVDEACSRPRSSIEIDSMPTEIDGPARSASLMQLEIELRGRAPQGEGLQASVERLGHAWRPSWPTCNEGVHPAQGEIWDAGEAQAIAGLRTKVQASDIEQDQVPGPTEATAERQGRSSTSAAELKFGVNSPGWRRRRQSAKRQD